MSVFELFVKALFSEVIILCVLAIIVIFTMMVLISLDDLTGEGDEK